MIKLVIIDFDDTLCLTEEACFHMENEVANSLGFPSMSRITHQENWGKPLAEAIIKRFPGINADKFMEKLALTIPKYTKEGKLDAILPQNLQTLDKLKKSGKKLAILTSRTFAEVTHLLHEKHPLNKRIEMFYHRDNSDYVKPDPRVFDKILAHFKVKPSEAVYIGDALSDALVTNKAGIHFIALLESNLRSKKDFSKYKVDCFASKFPDILKYLKLKN